VGKSINCLVTGAAGFIGSHLVDALLARGASVTGIDNLKLGRRENLLLALRNPRFKFFEADVNDLSAFRKIIVGQSKSAPFTAAWHHGREFRHPRGRRRPGRGLRKTRFSRLTIC
jgi:nucleoside-diphosphate-sugar epimerase